MLKPVLSRVAVTLLAAACLELEPALTAGPPINHKGRGAGSASGNPGFGAKGNGNQAKETYTFVDIKVDGSLFTSAVDITNTGVVAGIFMDLGGKYHSFLWTDRKTQVFDHPQAEHTLVGILNEAGILFGNWGSATEQHAGYYNIHTKQWTQLPDVPGYPVNIGQRMEETGTAIGYACRDSLFELLDCKGWLWNGRAYEPLNVPGAVSTYPYGLNNRGEVVGVTSHEPFEYRGFTAYRGIVKPLEISTPTGTLTATGNDITNSGKIVGVSPIPPSFYWPAILIDNGSYQLLPDYPGVVRTFYSGINERGDLVGIWFNDPSELPRSFVAFRKR